MKHKLEYTGISILGVLIILLIAAQCGPPPDLPDFNATSEAYSQKATEVSQNSRHAQNLMIGPAVLGHGLTRLIDCEARAVIYQGPTGLAVLPLNQTPGSFQELCQR